MPAIYSANHDKKCCWTKILIFLTPSGLRRQTSIKVKKIHFFHLRSYSCQIFSTYSYLQSKDISYIRSIRNLDVGDQLWGGVKIIQFYFLLQKFQGWFHNQLYLSFGMHFHFLYVFEGIFQIVART